MSVTARALDAGARWSCPGCERAPHVFLTEDEVAAELEARDRFFAARFSRSVSRDELRDITDVALGVHAAILRCMRCGILIRDEAPGDALFRDDVYRDDAMLRIHETHVRAFREKESDYRSLLRPHARVLEVGCYAGGFLAVAAEWSWRAAGTDIGRDAARFCRRRGFDARCLSLRDCELDDESFDAMFIWNCFEQLSDPRDVLAETHRVLRTGGLLVIRIPDAAFYIHSRSRDVRVLAYNGLLGWPHRFGYDEEALRRMAEPYGFTFTTTLRRAAVRPLREAMFGWARDEEAAVLAGAGHGWIELTFRKIVRSSL